MIQLPFTYSYTIINNVLTIIFDFSSLSHAEFNSLKRDYFSQGLVLNETGYDMNFSSGRRVHTYIVNTKDLTTRGDTRLKQIPFSGVANLRLMGTKVAEHNKATYQVGSSAYFDNEYQIGLFSGNDIQGCIDHLEVLKSNDQKELEGIIYDMQTKTWLDNSGNSWLARQKRELERVIENHESMIAHFTTEQNKVNGTNQGA